MTLIVGHRGYGANTINFSPKHAGYIQENTIESIAKALKTVNTVEIDVQMTKDGYIVVYHDDNLTEDGMKDISIDDIEWSMLGNFYGSRRKEDNNERLFEWCDPNHHNVSLLASVLKAFPNAAFNIELKLPMKKKNDHVFKKKFVSKVFHECESNAIILSRVIFSSFDMDLCLMMHGEVSPLSKVHLLLDPQITDGMELIDAFKLVSSTHLNGLNVHSSMLQNTSNIGIGTIRSWFPKIALWSYGRLVKGKGVDACIVDLHSVLRAVKM